VSEAESPLAVLGATGYTGALVCERAREAGLPLRLVGRRREALERIARPGEEMRVADARDEAALIRAFEGAFAVASLAGPFLELGAQPVAASLAAGAHYLDASGEQPFARLVYERFDEAARGRGVVLLTSFGFDYAVGDLAARIAAESLEEPLDEVAVGYAVSGFLPSAGTRRTAGLMLTQPLVAYSAGRLVDSRFGATVRRFRFPFGERTAVEWFGTEPLTVPRHTRVAEVRSYVRAPRAAPLLRLAGSLGASPSARWRSRVRFAVVAEARSGSARRRATLTGRDVYGLTGLLLVRGVEALRAGEARGAGALAPAEAFDARTLAGRLAPLLEVGPIEEF
jgi:short subunit dehydrogenase-like uncharacterized protein